MELKAIHENCSGCGTCRLACAMENHREVNPSLAVIRIQGRFPAPGDYRIHLCDQCGECAQACPENAITMDSNNVYRIDAEQCSGCLICAEVCPQGVIAEDKQRAIAIKCTLCGVCLEVCPRDAIIAA